MTKIQISDGTEAKAKKSASAKKAKKIIVTDAPAIHSTVQKSTTLSRRYVKKPATPKVEKAAEPAKKAVAAPAKKAEPAKKATATPAKAARPNVLNKLAEKRIRAEREEAKKAAKIAKARAMKATKKATKVARKVQKDDRALKSAAAIISKMSEEPVKKPVKMEREFKKKNKAGRVFLALICSGATVAALVAFVHFSIPDLSVRVAAIQTGIDATYPTFIPRNYSLSNVTSDKEGVIVMTFAGPDGASFTLSEEKSTWDSTALLNNYVKKNYPNDFTTLREQGITIYVRGEKASWVSGGLLYKIDATGKYLTKEQIRNIATSL